MTREQERLAARTVGTEELAAQQVSELPARGAVAHQPERRHCPRIRLQGLHTRPRGCSVAWSWSATSGRSCPQTGHLPILGLSSTTAVANLGTPAVYTRKEHPCTATPSPSSARRGESSGAAPQGGPSRLGRRVPGPRCRGRGAMGAAQEASGTSRRGRPVTVGPFAAYSNAQRSQQWSPEPPAPQAGRTCARHSAGGRPRCSWPVGWPPAQRAALWSAGRASMARRWTSSSAARSCPPPWSRPRRSRTRASLAGGCTTPTP